MSRVLFAASSGYGHVQPLLPLAAAVADAGHDVVLATGPDVVAVAEAHGIRPLATGLDMAETERRFRDRHPDADAMPPHERLPLVMAAMFGDIAARARAVSLIPFADTWRPQLVVHDLTEFSAPIAAARVGAPAVTHGISLLNPTPTIVDAVSPVVSDIAGEWGVGDVTASMLEAPFLDLCPPGLAIPLPTPFSDVRTIRPQLPPARNRELPLRLDGLPYAHTVLVTLGTVVNTSPLLFERILAGITDVPVNVVVTTGPGVDPGRLPEQPDHVVVERYVPYDVLLPRCSALVAHAGAGTLLASLAEGLPSVLVPQGAEQIANALAAQQAGVAVTLLPHELSPDALGAALHRVLAEEGFRTSAADIRSQIAAMPPASQVAARLCQEFDLAAPDNA